jgi:hypothetical protein
VRAGLEQGLSIQGWDLKPTKTNHKKTRVTIQVRHKKGIHRGRVGRTKMAEMATKKRNNPPGATGAEPKTNRNEPQYKAAKREGMGQNGTQKRKRLL